ncbi:hypothetical protein DXG01_014653 [Tephrocybe rancida]|nr:hypothetical protein DXG01_014653 [Tephrocybe rancida]
MSKSFLRTAYEGSDKTGDNGDRTVFERSAHVELNWFQSANGISSDVIASNVPQNNNPMDIVSRAVNLSTALIQYLYHLATLFIPAYLESQAAPITPTVRLDDSIELYNMHSTHDGEPEPRLQISNSDVIAHPGNTQLATSPLPRGWNSLPSTHSSILSENEEMSDEISPKQVKLRWTAYVECRCAEWVIIASAAGTAIVASPSFLQIPGANTDLVVRAFFYLSIFCLVPAIPMSILLLYYFKKNSFRSSEFSVAWNERAKRRSRTSCLRSPYMILASPAIALCWGMIFFLLGLLLSVWRNGLLTNLESSADNDPVATAFSRTSISAMLIADFTWIVWLVMTLRALDKDTKPAHPAVRSSP